MLSRSQNLYNRIASYYRDYSHQKSAYLDSIDKIIINEVKKCDNLLDIGSADGVRAYKIAKELNVKRLILLDNSKEMAKICAKSIKAEYWLKDIAGKGIVNIKDRFEVITCLWNVLGHIEGEKRRRIALVNMRNLLEENGVIFFDVNNRYNMIGYGLFSVIKNMIKDIFSPSENNGNFEFNFHFDGKEIPASVHLFNPLEIEKLIKNCDLKIVKRFYLNYKTGEQSKTPFSGQLLYKISRK